MKHLLGKAVIRSRTGYFLPDPDRFLLFALLLLLCFALGPGFLADRYARWSSFLCDYPIDKRDNGNEARHQHGKAIGWTTGGQAVALG
jgi:hypothetical protein